MKAYVIIEINKGDPYQWQTDVVGVWLNENNAKAEADRLNSEDEKSSGDWGRYLYYEVLEFDAKDAE